MQTYSWIKTELKHFYPKADFTKGIDLDRNGKVSANERITDDNNNGAVGDPADWRAFMKRNAVNVKSLSPLFKYSSGLKPDNPLHDILSVERLLAKPGDIARVYKIVKAIIPMVKQKIVQDARRKMYAGDVPMSFMVAFDPTFSAATPQGKLMAVYYALGKLNIVLKGQGINTLLVQNLRARAVDCDTSSFITLAVAHEMGWPVRMVMVPGHAFLRWDDGRGTKFNFDQGKLKKDAYYVSKYKIHPKSVRSGAYLKGLTRDELVGSVYNNLSAVLADRKQDAAAYASALQGVSYYSKGARSQYYLGATLMHQGKYRQALAAITSALTIAPRDAKSYLVRSRIRRALGDMVGATQDRSKALIIDPAVETK